MDAEPLESKPIAAVDGIRKPLVRAHIGVGPVLVASGNAVSLYVLWNHCYFTLDRRAPSGTNPMVHAIGFENVRVGLLAALLLPLVWGLRPRGMSAANVNVSLSAMKQRSALSLAVPTMSMVATLLIIGMPNFGSSL